MCIQQQLGFSLVLVGVYFAYSIFARRGRIYLCFVYFPCGPSVFSSVLFLVWASLPVFCILSLASQIHSRGRVLGLFPPRATASDMALAR